MTLARRLPAFTWDRIAPLREKAGLHPDGPVDLSMGTPVDPVPGLIRDALAAASDAPGYPATWGTPRLRSAAAGWLARAHGVPVSPDDVLPVVGTKEFIAWLPVMLGLGPGDVVLQPELAYPTYDIGARLAGASVLASDSLLGAGPARVRLVWVNSPSNPTGRVLPAEHLRKVVAWARERGAVVASDECYISLGWDAAPVSVLHPSVCGGSHDGVLAVHSLSKRSNLAGYRAGFVTGDPALVADLLAIRKQAGMIMPGPVQAAMAAALSDDVHAAEQRERYAARRSVCVRLSPRRAGSSTTPRRACTCGSRIRRTTAGRRPNCSPPRAASWSPRASCTVRPGNGTSGWRSPPPWAGAGVQASIDEQARAAIAGVAAVRLRGGGHHRLAARCRIEAHNWTTATATRSGSSSSARRKAGARPASSRTRSTPRPSSTPPSPRCTATPRCRSTRRLRTCSTARTVRPTSSGPTGRAADRLLHREVAAQRVLLVHPVRPGEPGGGGAADRADVRAGGAESRRGEDHHRPFGQKERKSTAVLHVQRAAAWTVASWLVAHARPTTSAKYGMPVSPGKPRMAVWAGSANPTRHRRQGRTVSSLAEAASSGDPPYCVSSRTTTGVHP